MARVLVSLLLLAAAATAGQAGWLSDSLKNALENTAKKMAHEAADDAVDAAQSRKSRALEGRGSEAPPAPADESARQERPSPPPSPSPDQVTASDADFLPGATVLFSDDFAETPVGQAPRRWTRDGPGGGGTPAEVTEAGGRRLLALHPPGRDEPTGWSQLFLPVSGHGDLPQKLTFEFEAVLSPPSAGYVPTYAVHLLGEGDYPRDAGDVGTLAFSATEAASANARATLSCADGKLHRIAVAVDGTGVTAFVDGARVLSDPRAVSRPVRYVGMGMGRGYGDQKIRVTGVRLAEGGGVVGRAPAKALSARAAPQSGGGDGLTGSEER